MKTTKSITSISKFVVTIIILALTVLFGCNKEKEDVSTTSENGVGRTQNTQTIDEHVPASGSRYLVYGARCCTAEGGVSGCQCEIVPDNDNCDQITDCIADPTYPTYDSVYQSMFTDGQIILRRERKTRISEPALLQALEQDGFPFAN